MEGFSIHFLWSESGWFQGRYGEGGAVVNSWEEADRILYQIASNKRSTLGYDKTAFQIRLGDRVAYEGRYDVYSIEERQENPNGHCDLRDHIRGSLEFWAGTRCPAHMTPERYEAYRQTMPTNIQAAQEWLKKHGELLRLPEATE